jgi:hypothetical protein
VEAYDDSLAIFERFNARLSAKKTAWFWPTVGAALASKHHSLVIACDACETVIDLDLTVERRELFGLFESITAFAAQTLHSKKYFTFSELDWISTSHIDTLQFGQVGCFGRSGDRFEKSVRRSDIS